MAEHLRKIAMRNCSSTLWATVATLALTGTLLVPISVAQASETASPKATPRVRIPATPPKIENGSRIRTEIPVPEEELKDAEDDRVKAESAEAEPKVRTRVGTPRIESSTPVTVETNPRIRTRIATPNQDEAPTESTKPRRVRIGAPPVDEAKPVDAENAPYNRKRIAVPVEGKTTQDEAPQGRRRQDRADQSESQPVDSGNTRSMRQADIPYKRRRIDTGSADINTAPADDSPAEEPAKPKPKRLGTPDLGAVSAKAPDGPIRSVDSAQAECLYRPNMNDDSAAQSKSSERVNILAMVCRVNGDAKLMSFSYDIPAEYYTAPANSRPLIASTAAYRHHEAKRLSTITYELGQTQTDSEGNPVFRLLTIALGDETGTNVSCIDPDASLNIHSLSDNKKGTAIQRWCSDGKTIGPVQFQVNGWVRPWRSKETSVSIGTYDSQNPKKFNNLYTVRYHEAMRLAPQESSLIGESSPQLDSGKWDCTLDSNQIGSLYCSTDPVKGVVTTYLVYSLPEIREKIPVIPTAKCETVVKPFWDENRWSDGVGSGGSLSKFIRYYDYKIMTCDVSRIVYQIIKSPVPAQYRGDIKGACFLANVAGLKSQKVVTITFSRAVEATDTGNTVYDVDLGNPDNSKGKREVIEGKTISTNGSISPNTRLNEKGERVPLENITKVNAACN
jgi:hypothetical protein